MAPQGVSAKARNRTALLVKGVPAERRLHAAAPLIPADVQSDRFVALSSQVNAGAITMVGTSGQKFNMQGSLAKYFCADRDGGSNADAEIQLSKGDRRRRHVQAADRVTILPNIPMHSYC